MHLECELRFPNSHELADYFLRDARDNLDRLRYWYFNNNTLAHTRKSKRTKAANDMLIAFECLVKGMVTFHKFSDLNGQILYNKVRNFGHQLTKLGKACNHVIPDEKYVEVNNLANELNVIPFGVRYWFDAYSFWDTRPEIYDATIGSDTWMQRIYDEIQALLEWQIQIMERPIGEDILHGETLLQQMVRPRFNP